MKHLEVKLSFVFPLKRPCCWYSLGSPQTIEPVQQTFKPETQFRISFTPSQVRPIVSRICENLYVFFLDLPLKTNITLENLYFQ